MADGERVIAGDLLYERTHKIRRNDHVQGGKDGCEDDELAAREARVDACGDEYEWEPIEHVAGEEDGLPLGEAGDKNIDRESEDHDDADLSAVFGSDVHRGRFDRLGHDGVEGGRNAVDRVSRDEPVPVESTKKPTAVMMVPRTISENDFFWRIRPMHAMSARKIAPWPKIS